MGIGQGWKEMAWCKERWKAVGSYCWAIRGKAHGLTLQGKKSSTATTPYLSTTCWHSCTPYIGISRGNKPQWWNKASWCQWHHHIVHRHFEKEQPRAIPRNVCSCCFFGMFLHESFMQCLLNILFSAVLSSNQLRLRRTLAGNQIIGNLLTVSWRRFRIRTRTTGPRFTSQSCLYLLVDVCQIFQVDSNQRPGIVWCCHYWKFAIRCPWPCNTFRLWGLMWEGIWPGGSSYIILMNSIIVTLFALILEYTVFSFIQAYLRMSRRTQELKFIWHLSCCLNRSPWCPDDLSEDLSQISGSLVT
jgi:hypothetical protein